jgi:hypothetical protein
MLSYQLLNRFVQSCPKQVQRALILFVTVEDRSYFNVRPKRNFSSFFEGG